jgi:hypothetical protein
MQKRGRSPRIRALREAEETRRLRQPAAEYKIVELTPMPREKRDDVMLEFRTVLREHQSAALREQHTSLEVEPPPPSQLPSPPPPPSPSLVVSAELAAAVMATPLGNGSGLPHTELWGGVVVPGNSNEQPTATACRDSCTGYEPVLDVANGAQCTSWVWNPTSKECWLKTQKSADLEPALRRLLEKLRSGEQRATPWRSGVELRARACDTCKLPASFTGCVTKTKCNTSRLCGSPAIDGYAHVDSDCLERSPTQLAYLGYLADGMVLDGHREEGLDLDGLGVRWGIGHTKQTWRECEQACRDHRPSAASAARRGPFSRLPCNVWTWCGKVHCFEPDAHKHSFGDCWLKFSESPAAPEVNMRVPMLKSYMQRHRKELPIHEAKHFPWWAGVLLAPGTRLSNGTWGPRAFW